MDFSKEVLRHGEHVELQNSVTELLTVKGATSWDGEEEESA